MINLINDELLREILKHLSSYERALACKICKRWVSILRAISIEADDRPIDSYHLFVIRRYNIYLPLDHHIITSKDIDIFKTYCSLRGNDVYWINNVYSIASLERIEIVHQINHEFKTSLNMLFQRICAANNKQAIEDCISKYSYSHQRLLMKYVCERTHSYFDWKSDILKRLSIEIHHRPCLYCKAVHQ